MGVLKRTVVLRLEGGSRGRPSREYFRTMMMSRSALCKEAESFLVCNIQTHLPRQILVCQGERRLAHENRMEGNFMMRHCMRNDTTTLAAQCVHENVYLIALVRDKPKRLPYPCTSLFYSD